MDAQLIQTIAVYTIPVLFAITLHEAAHGYAARHFGDDTAARLGRLSLNPLRHIDPFGTIAMPLLLYFASNGSFVFGYAKPVPVNISALKHPKADMLWVAFAGPGANLLMALGWVVAGILAAALGVTEAFFMGMATAGLTVNLAMAALNLFPLPPLDGGRMLMSLLPMNLAVPLSRIEPWGFFVVIGLAVTGVLSLWMLPVMGLLNDVVQFFSGPFTWLL